MRDGSEGVTAPATVEVGSGSGSAPPGDGERTTGDIGRQLGRYVVVDEIGAGGMGRVYRAYDPKLRREVAIKLLRVAPESSTAQARMLREAQSMAQLSHPNVVPVYDVDAHGENLFIAMEYVDGDTLRAWLGARERTWREVIEVFVEAGEGLRAAHEQGIVHRDFKPSNVIVGRDGRTRVMDFGLARMLEELPSSVSSGDFGQHDDPASDSPVLHTDALTEHGTVMGTPAYMAPEQHRSEPTDARTDQYAFCTTLWEALYGARPFKAKSLEQLALVKLGEPPRPPTGARVPAAVHALVMRGLAAKPDERWPDMATLLTAIGRAQSSRGPGPMVGVGGAALAIGGLLFAYGGDQPCQHGQRQIEEVWSDQARTQVGEGLAKSGVGFAESTAERVNAALDDYASAYVTMHRDSCEATKVRHEQSDEALDLRMACLASRRDELGTLVSLFSTADEGVAERAVELATGLTPIAGCGDLAALRSRVPPPNDPEVARQVQQARDALSRAELAREAGRTGDALETTDATLKLALQLDYEPLVAEAELAHALALWADGTTKEALPRAEHALESALRLSMKHLAADAAIALTGLIDSQQGRVAEARWLARVGLALAQGDGTDAPLIADAMLQVGNLHAQDERLLDAEPYFQGAVEHIENELGPEHPSIVPVLSSYASLLQALQRDDEAERVTARARALAERAFGPDHPSTGELIRRQAWQLMGTGQFEEAEEKFSEAKAIYEAALGPDHPSTLALLATMAGSLAEQGRYEEAAANIIEAERRLGARVAEDHPMRASFAHNLARVRTMQGNHEAAVDLYRRAIEIRRRLGMKNDLAAALGSQARALIELERYEEAQAALQEADEIDAATFAERGSRSPQPSLELGKLARRRGDLIAAAQYFETAWVFGEKSGTPAQRSQAALLLGQTLWEAGVDRERGRELVRQAIEIATSSNADDAAELADQAGAWLSAHPQRSPEHR